MLTILLYSVPYQQSYTWIRQLVSIVISCSTCTRGVAGSNPDSGWTKLCVMSLDPIYNPFCGTVGQISDQN